MDEKKSALEIFAEKIAADVKDFVTSEGKRAFIVALRTEVIPALKAVVSPMLEECEKQGKTETGWCKVRDLIVLPLVIEVGLWGIQKILDKTKEV